MEDHSTGIVDQRLAQSRYFQVQLHVLPGHKASSKQPTCFSTPFRYMELHDGLCSGLLHSRIGFDVPISKDQWSSEIAESASPPSYHPRRQLPQRPCEAFLQFLARAVFYKADLPSVNATNSPRADLSLYSLPVRVHPFQPDDVHSRKRLTTAYCTVEPSSTIGYSKLG